MNNRVDRTNNIDNQLEDQSIRNDLDELSEDINTNIQLSEIWEFNSLWHFNIKEDIKWKDDKWNYIEIRWNKYYDSKNSIRNWEWLWYNLIDDRSWWSDILYIWNMSWRKLEWKWIKFRDWIKFVGDWKNNKMDWYGYRTFNDGSTFDWLWKEWQPINWTYEKHKENWEREYIYEWWINEFWEPHWYGKCVWENWKEKEYEWDFVDWKYHWHGEIIYSNWHSYKWDFLDWKKHWRGIYSYRDGHTDECEWVNDKPKEWKIIQTRANGEKYVWDFLLDDNWVIRRFYELSDPNDKDSPTIYQIRRKRQISEWNNQALSNINMEWILTLPDWSHHEFKLTNWSITEESNDFITIYGDKKPDEDRSNERWNIKYTIDYTSDSHIKYIMSSWKRKITWELKWWAYQFKNKKWDTLSIPKKSNFGDKHAMHAANLINSIRYINANAHGNRKFSYSWDKKLCATTVVYSRANYWCPTSAAIAAWPLYTQEINSTVLVEDVSLHFWWISAKELANWLNN